MDKANLFRGIEFIRDLSVQEFLMFFIYLALILLVKGVVQWLFKSLLHSHKRKEQLLPLFEDILNWLAFYSGILLFFFYFSEEQWFFYDFYETEGVSISVYLLVVAILVVTFANRVVKTFNRHVMPFVYEQFDINIGLGYTINRLIYYSVMFLALILTFTTVGIDLTAVGVVFSVLGIGIGFGVRNIAANFVAGIIILFERPMEVGEMVEIEKTIGEIKRIKLRSTEVETLKDGTLVVPNQYFIEQIVKNRSSAQLFARVVVSIMYGSDTEKVETLLLAAAEKEIKAMEEVPDNPPDIRFIEFRNSAMEFQVEVQVVDVKMKQILESRIRHSIAEVFFENGIQLAAPPVPPAPPQ